VIESRENTDCDPTLPKPSLKRGDSVARGANVLVAATAERVQRTRHTVDQGAVRHGRKGPVEGGGCATVKLGVDRITGFALHFGELPLDIGEQPLVAAQEGKPAATTAVTRSDEWASHAAMAPESE
jgi:hypothetical protein